MKMDAFVTAVFPVREDAKALAARNARRRANEDASVTPCFTPGTAIATPTGARMVEDLCVGDKVLTRDNGIQKIRWIGARRVSTRELANQPHLKPVLIHKGSLGNDLPERDMMLSPNHRVLVASNRTALYFEEREVLAAAKHLINHRDIREVNSTSVTYIHFMFDQHEVVLSNGAWSESFQPGDKSLKSLGNAQRGEILDLFPELNNVTRIDTYLAARRVLTGQEARRLQD